MIHAWLTVVDGGQAPRRRRRAGTMRAALFAVALPALLLGQVPTVSPEPIPATPVERLHASLSDAGKTATSLADRYRQLEPTIRKSFDFPLIARLVLGSHWHRLSDEQKGHFINRFTAVSIASYARRFPGGGTEFRQHSTVPLKQGRILVKTELTADSGDTVYLDYLVHRGDGSGWVIIGVIANGVNELALKHSEYGSMVKRSGFDGLMAELEKQLAELNP